MRKLLVGAFILSCGITFAQKKNETSAAIAFNKYNSALRSQDFAEAKKQLQEAKSYIDLAASHVDTENNDKTLYLKGQVYTNYIILALTSADTSLISQVGEDALDIAAQSFKKGYAVGKKKKGDIEDAVQMNRAFFDKFAMTLYQAKQYKEAAELYEVEAKYMDAINQLDTNSYFNTGLCYDNADMPAKAAENFEIAAKADFRGATSYALASNAYRKAGNIEKAKEIIDLGRQKHPTNRDLLLEMVNVRIDDGDAAGAEAALQAAIEADPSNKILFYTIGTIYIDLKQYEKAEEALNKALEIDPQYVDAQFQLGAHLVNWASEVNTEAKQLKLGDPNYDKMIERSNELYNKALVPLEEYIKNNENDKDVLNILFQIHRSLKNTEKAIEYKRRADAL